MQLLSFPWEFLIDHAKEATTTSGARLRFHSCNLQVHPSTPPGPLKPRPQTHNTSHNKGCSAISSLAQRLPHYFGHSCMGASGPGFAERGHQGPEWTFSGHHGDIKELTQSTRIQPSLSESNMGAELG